MRTMNLLIVDDEPLICEGLAKTISWEEIGVSVVGIANNGNEAIEIVKKESVDIILTDVCMPEMDGLALAELISTEHGHIDIIMFSGYDEFDYARQSIRLGVKDYLLKPVNIDELIELVTSIIKDKDLGEKLADPYLEDSNSAIKHWISHYIFHEPTNETFFPAWLYNYNFRVLVSEMTGYFIHGERDSPWKEDWFEYIQSTYEVESIRSVVISNHENEMITVFFTSRDITIDQCQIEAACLQFNRDKDFQIQHGLSAEISTVKNVHNLYKEARHTLDNIREKDKLLESTPKLQVVSFQLPHDRVLELQNAILNANKELISSTSNHLLEHFRSKEYPVHTVFKLLQEMEIILLSNLPYLMKKRGTLNLQLQEKTDDKIYNSYEAMQQLLMADLNILVEEQHQPNKKNWIIHQAIKYMETNYQKEIKAQQVAEDHFITPNHFSVLFKQETGQSFSEYLNAYRINKASELLLTTSNRVFEIAEFVGYSEYKYFVKVFKKHNGVTPTYFRSLHTDIID